MVDITHKSNTLRIATAQAIVKVSSQATIDALQNDTVPKGNVFAMSKAAGLLGVKKTPELLPDCHPMPIEFTGITYEIEGLNVVVKVTVKTIYKTGVEVEAMHGASVVALNMYDMLKPIDKGVEIHAIKLLQKKGGKTSYPVRDVSEVKAAVIVCSDTISQGKGEDKSGKLIKEKLEGYQVTTKEVEVVPDDFDTIQQRVLALKEEYNLIVLTGGTGLSARDTTPEAILPLLDKRIVGAEETIRRYGQERMPYAMLSRSVVGTIDNSCLVLALPGSSKGVVESLDAVFPHLFHSYKVLTGERH
ncbi:bifunctional molybdenum cofactor biosynthesis protein MoaC/MoaB [uncultured Tenacibaculum sp.]|uniref:bifunctional molybdenum cofactor biosynthesis protein MoaC/MoaB n=1 Tax=uncultured Tenacibaculum sp. TaxID=174713 RepID=UPI00260E02B9|nr:bifunctional molybdenum cofactor biosynthesis protein MoaC/MoaB [uncultured Tenacibaculum sp.]